MQEASSARERARLVGLAGRRQRFLLGASSLTVAVALAAPALALDECGAAAPGGTVTCTPAGNPFPGGIEYKVPDLTVVVQDGVIVDTTGKAGEPGGVVVGGAGNYGNLTVRLGTVDQRTVTITTDDDEAAGVSVETKDGTASAYSFFGSIATTGEGSIGISVNADKATRLRGSGGIVTTGDDAIGISSHADDGSVTIDFTGSVATAGENADGVLAVGSGEVDVRLNSDISTTGEDSDGVDLVSTKDKVVVYSQSNISTRGYSSVGIRVQAASDATIRSSGNITTAGKLSSGIRVLGDSGIITVNSAGNIATDGAGSNGIEILANDGSAAVTSVGDITTIDEFSNAISVDAKSDVLIRSTGDISIGGKDSEGLFGFSAEGNTAIYSSGDIVMAGNNAIGIYAGADAGLSYVRSTGDIVATGDGSVGIRVSSETGSALVISKGDITADGSAIKAESTDKSVVIQSTGRLATAAAGADAILARSLVGGVAVQFDGVIVTDGANAAGIHAVSTDSTAAVYAFGDIETQGLKAYGIQVVTAGDGSSVFSSGVITTAGQAANGIRVSSDEETKIVNTGEIRTSGKFASGIYATAQEHIYIRSGRVTTTGIDTAGLLVDTGDSFDIVVTDQVSAGIGNSVGLKVGATEDSTIVITQSGAVGALNDFAILDRDDKVEITNNGRLTGTFFLDADDDVLINNGLYEVRSFADVNGDGVRDQEAVAGGDFGADDDTFVNNGVLRLSRVDGAIAFDTSGQILHPGGGNSDILQEGVEQGQFLNLELFVNSGLITLADGTAGDLLVITDQNSGETKGAGIFRSEGGALALDAVLDDGSSKQSDVLILDKAETGTGATRVFVGNAGGQGGQTTGDGILVINVRDKSDADAFASGGPAVAGAYQYDLFFQNVAKTDQNWYLRSSFFEGALEYPSISSGALETFQAGFEGIGDQLRKRRAQVTAQDAALTPALGQVAELPNTATDVADASSAVRLGDGGGSAGWFRVSGADMDIEQDASADFDLNTVRAEAGVDVGFNNVLADDWLVAGAFAGYGWSSVGFDSGSEVDFNIATVGAYATYFRGPYYLDAVVKLDWLDGSFNSENVSEDGDLSLPVFGVSLESGYRFDLTPNGFYLQPQAQLSYAHSGDDSFKDDAGAKVELQDADSLRGRLGARLGQELSTTAGAASEPVRGNFYLEASVNQEFLGETEAKVSGLTLQQDLPDTTYQVGGGIDIALPKSGVSFTVDADYTFGEDADGVSATGGFRINW